MPDNADSVYKKQLLGKGLGLPMRNARPHKTPLSPHLHEACIGHVGYLANDGHFIPMFNTIDPDHHPRPGFQLPENLERLAIPPDLEMMILTEEDVALNAGEPITSASVNRWSFVAGAQVETIPLAPGGKIEFSINQKQAAILYPHGPISSKRLKPNSTWVTDYVIRNVNQWYDYADKLGLGLKRGDIIFVTGWYKTVQWDNFTYMSGAQDIKVVLSGGFPLVAEGEFSVSHERMRAVSADRLFGPDLPSQLPTSNQCLFLQGYKIGARMRPKRLLDLRLRAAAEPEDPEEGQDEASTDAIRSDLEPGNLMDVDLVALQDNKKPYHPLDCIIEHILSNPSVKIAIAHDMDVTEILEALGVSPDKFEAYIQMNRPNIYVNERGVGSINPHLLQIEGASMLWPSDSSHSTTASVSQIQSNMSTSSLSSGVGTRHQIWENLNREVNNLLSLELNDNPSNIKMITRTLLTLLDTPNEGAYTKSKLISEDKNKAQSFVNFLQFVLDDLLGLETRLYERRAAIRRLMSNIAKNANVFPEKIYLKGVEWGNSTPPHAGGTYADVLIGSYEGKEVAIKRLRLFDPKDITSRERNLCREALVCRQLRHHRLLPLLGIVENPAKNSLCLVTPWIESGNLKQYQRRALETMDAVPFNLLPLLIQVAEGLVWLHGENMVHGDIKADNILVDEKGNVKITDFGLTLHVDNSGPAHTGPLGGSFRWMAPELHVVLTSDNDINEKWKPTFKADVYSFAHTMVEAYTLTSPFPQLSSNQLVTLSVIRGYRPPRPNLELCFGRHLSDALWALIKRCWAQEPAQRPAIGEVLADLEKIYERSD